MPADSEPKESLREKEVDRWDSPDGSRWKSEGCRGRRGEPTRSLRASDVRRRAGGASRGVSGMCETYGDGSMWYPGAGVMGMLKTGCGTLEAEGSGLRSEDRRKVKSRPTSRRSLRLCEAAMRMHSSATDKSMVETYTCRRNILANVSI